ncbi:MAG TPA: hypothetical protein VEX37_09835 [Thermomicrobiales bacterium]|nr:hypothetical protein [Thermomicrobiales bacterium]
MNAQGPAHQYNAEPLVVEEERRRFRIAPGAIVLLLGLVLAGLIVVGVLANRSSEPGVEAVTIADLRADPDGWDNRRVTLVGSVESVRELPLLSQYAIYTFRDETGSMLALTRNGAPPDGNDQRVTIEAVFHSKVRLDDELNDIVADQLGPLVGAAVSALLPGVPLDVVYLGHDSYEVME